MRHHNGVHYKGVSSEASLQSRCLTHLLEELDDYPEQAAKEELVATCHGGDDVPKGYCRAVLLGVGELVQTR